MSTIDAYGGRRVAEVMQETWGHLRPDAGRAYRGLIVFAHGQYGDMVPINVDFEGLDDSPWFFDDLNDFVIDQDTEAGKVYRFDGTYRSDREARFLGEVTAVELPQTLPSDSAGTTG